MEKKLAVIDIGSNSIRNVIFEVNRHGQYFERLNVKEVARLSSHITDANELSEMGIQSLIETLDHFISLNKHHGVKEMLPVATAAIRNASNSEAILNEVLDATGMEIRLLSDYEEAYYGYSAIVNSTYIEDGYSVDIGGGSMEVTYFKDRELVFYHSFPFGAVTLTNDFMSGDTLSKDERKQLTAFLKKAFKDIDWLVPHGVPLVGVGGTARNLVRVEQSLSHFPLEGIHQYTLGADRLHEVVDELIDMSTKQLGRLDGLSKDRMDIIAPAVTAIDELARYLKVPEFTMSNNGLREGLFYEYYLKENNEIRFADVKEESFRHFEKQYDVDPVRHRHLVHLARQIYMGLIEAKTIKPKPFEPGLLEAACRLAYVGEYIDHNNKSDHTFHLITTNDFKGMNNEDRLALALVTSYKSRRLLEQHIEGFPEWFDSKMLKSLELIGSIVKLVDALDLTERQVVENIDIETTDDGLAFTLHTSTSPRFELQRGIRHKKHLERAIETTIELRVEERITL
ncbi:phosphatase [Exiguobacterium sp. SH31]|uniref:Ppx/GppA family phosphatase n=1 Tax=Exiguobacterium sp. SH31 TaxID=1843183 RepID=UPI0008D2A2BF|nr:Ppx/GppA family phosphatase [Exiguobacterium sp. SH31]OGX80222.1 phosphatase [Exiguobacterium sp. SH31]